MDLDGDRDRDSGAGLWRPLTRRRFIRNSGLVLLGATALGAGACQGDQEETAPEEATVDGENGFTAWGWPLPYEQISDESRTWLEDQRWWPLQAGWIVVWSGEELVGHILQSQELLQKRGIEAEWSTFTGAGFSNEAFAPGRIQLANTGALGVLALMATGVPVTALAVHSPALQHAALVREDSPLQSLADLKDQQVLGRPAVIGTTTGSTNHFGFLAAAAQLGLNANSDYTLRSLEPADNASAPEGVDVYTIWQPHVANSVQLVGTRILEPLDRYYMYSGYSYCREELHQNVPDVVQAITDSFVEAVLWGRVNQDEALDGLLSLPDYSGADPEIIKQLADEYFFWPKPTVYYPFDHASGVWPKEESRISAWAYETGAVNREITEEDWRNVRKAEYMDGTFEKLGWKVPSFPPFLPEDFEGVGELPYPPYAAELLDGPATFPEGSDLTKEWIFDGETYQPS